MRDSVFFFFQAEDGIRDYKVTGVQTCALPIFPRATPMLPPRTIGRCVPASCRHRAGPILSAAPAIRIERQAVGVIAAGEARSVERLLHAVMVRLAQRLKVRSVPKARVAVRPVVPLDMVDDGCRHRPAFLEAHATERLGLELREAVAPPSTAIE